MSCMVASSDDDTLSLSLPRSLWMQCSPSSPWEKEEKEQEKWEGDEEEKRKRNMKIPEKKEREQHFFLLSFFPAFARFLARSILSPTNHPSILARIPPALSTRSRSSVSQDGTNKTADWKRRGKTYIPGKKNWIRERLSTSLTRCLREWRIKPKERRVRG